MKLSKKDAYISMIMVATNLLTYFLLIPYVQKTANSHINSGPFFGTSYYILAGLLLLFGLNELIKRKNYQRFILLFIFAISLSIWAYKLHAIECLSCLLNG
jgi:hypothetical protein